MNTTVRMKRFLCLSACLLISVLCCKWVISSSALENQSMDTLIAERAQILDALDKLNFRIDSVRTQLQELEDDLVKKNERLSVIEGQLSAFK